MIKELFEKDFTQKGDGVYINKRQCGMMIVKADWCGHCRRALPEFENVSKLTGEAFQIYKLDADKNKKITTSMGVTGFPTIFFIEEDGKVSRHYTKERITRTIVDEICSVMKKCF